MNVQAEASYCAESADSMIRSALPDIWGAGQLLGFSGIDGDVDWYSQLVLHTDVRPGSFQVRLPISTSFEVALPESTNFQMILSDAIVANTVEGAFRLAYIDGNTVIGEMPCDSKLVVNQQTIRGDVQVVRAESDLLLCAGTSGNRWTLFSLAVAQADEAAAVAKRALAADLDRAVEQRAAFVRDVAMPATLTETHAQLLRKAVSILKVNTQPAMGAIKRMWSTPDRWPHRYMWLWDSAFHAVGMLHVDATIAKEILLAMLEQADDDGFLPLMASPDGRKSDLTQPPILAWAVAKVLRKTGDVDWARACEPYLSGYLDWDRQHRDQNGNDLLEWAIEGNPLCRSGESGMDNSPRFDGPDPVDAVDFSCLLVNDYAHLAEIATATGNDALRTRSLEAVDAISAAIEQHLWDEDQRFYFDRTFDGRFSTIKASSGFLPLFAKVANESRAAALVEHLNDPRSFATSLPVPSVSLDDGTFCKDMWRGPTWININYMIYEGLLAYGYTTQARQLREQILQAITRWYHAEGCIFEYYDALDVTSPQQLDRKQRLASGNGIAPISDYHWSAAMTVALLFDQ